MIKVRPIELLAPARNVECGMEAIRHGADAVYIGAPKYGARAAAGNSVHDIARLVTFAHFFNARIYVTVNVILKDEELEDVRKMIYQLYDIGVDALIVQDMALLQLDLPPISLHASTQADNRTSEKVNFLSRVGFQQIVLARELSLEEIKKIHEANPDVLLESFVHGALCVSYSGQCYASQACFGRSANRGECAQFCRLAFDMQDADGKTIVQNKHLLSLKDLNLSDRLEALMDAGISSFKIEGRLKDVSYVKNVTALYRQKIDAVLERRDEYVRSSSGHSTYTFQPQVDKSFNRGFTSYFIDGRGDEILSPDSPKSIGEVMGTVKEARPRRLLVEGTKKFHNGDGACFFDDLQQLHGFRINKTEDGWIIPQNSLPPIKRGTQIYRNYDQEFEQLLSVSSAERRIYVDILIQETSFGFLGTITDEDGNHVILPLYITKEKSRLPQRERLIGVLSKLGSTSYEARHVDIQTSEEWFVPVSAVTDFRRKLVEELSRLRKIHYSVPVAIRQQNDEPFPEKKLTYLGNVMNEEAARFYRLHGVTEIAPAFEKQEVRPAPVMFCRHCLRFTMGWCPQHHSEKSPYREPYYLVLPDSRRFLLEFDCKNCQMKVITQ
jgi:collagenase-like PrtC family protease